MRWALHAKIHQATVTQADVSYVGSITVDADLMEKAGFWQGEKVLVVSTTNGERLETYIIPGERNSGEVCMNGAAAHRIQKGHVVIIIGFELTDKPIKAKKVLVDKQNKFVRFL